MTAPKFLSLGVFVPSEVSLQTFALNCCVPETLSEVVLGTVSTAMATVTDDGNDQFTIFLVIAENLLEAIAQVVKVFFITNRGLKDARLHLRR